MSAFLQQYPGEATVVAVVVLAVVLAWIEGKLMR